MPAMQPAYAAFGSAIAWLRPTTFLCGEALRVVYRLAFHRFSSALGT
jgi:hypothetical protein